MSTKLFKWKIYCTTDNQFEYIWQVNSPTTCPINGGHSVDANRISKEGDIFCLTITDTNSPYNYGKSGLLSDTTNGNITVNLPKASRSTNGIVFIKKIAAGNTVTIDGFESELIDALATKTLTSLNEMAILLCDGFTWTSQTQRANINDVCNLHYLPKTFTKGDILVDDGNDTQYLPIGTDNYLMVADSGQNEGVIWSNSLNDNVINFENNADTTKKARFDLSSITTGNTRVITIPDENTTIVGTATTQTLTNKTINTASNTITIATGDVTSGTFADDRIAASNVTQHEGAITIGNLIGAPTGAVIGTTDTQTLANKTLTSPVLTTPQINDTSADHQYIFGVSELTIDRTVTLPLLTANDTFAFEAHTQTLTNKTIDTANNTLIVATGDVTSGTFADARISVSNITQHEGAITIGNLSGAPTGTVVGTTDSQTLTNKTLTAPIISTISNTGTITLPTATDTLVGRSTTDTLTNKTFGDNLNLNNNKIINLTTPTADTDGATKAYVDSVATGLDVKDSVVSASTLDLDSNTSISGTITYNSTAGVSSRGQITATLVTTDVFTIDGVSFGISQNSSRILLKDQTTGAQNGIWITTISGTSLTLDRDTDFDTDTEVTSGAFMFIEQGTNNADTGWTLTTNDPITIGGASGTSLSFSQFSGAGQITAGTGMTKTGNTLNVAGSTTIISNADDLHVNSSNTANQILLSSGTVGTASTFGTLPLGDSNAVSGTLSVLNGGSGQTTLASGKILQGNGTGGITSTLTSPTGDIIGTTDTQTLTNKTLIDNTTYFQDDLDNTKKLQLQLSGITTGNTRVLTIPDTNDTLVGLIATQTLTNKTINTASNTITLDTADVTTGTFVDARIAVSNITQHEGSITIGNLLGAPSSTVVGTTDTQTLTNKTLTSAVLTLPQINDTSSDHQYIFAVSELTLDRTVTLPLLTTNDTFVFANHPDTFTNKTINADSNTITNIDNADIKASASIDTTKIANGTVTNTEFQYLNAVTSDIQTQLNGKSATSHNHSTSDITSGTLPVSRGGSGSTTLTQDGWLIGNGTGAITAIKNNMNASIAPNSATDDITLGYDIGSRWFDTTANKEYVCLDNTDGTAIWSETTQSGETNTASNIGTGGIGIYKQKTGSNIELKKINSTSATSGISIVDDTGNDEVDVRLDINSLTADATPDGSADYIVTYDTSSTGHKKVLINNLPSSAIFGSEYTISIDNTLSSTTSTTFVQKQRMTTASIPAGDYKISWYYELKTDKAITSINARIQLNDTTNIHNTSIQLSNVTDFYPQSGWDNITLTAAIHDIDLDYSTNSGSGVGCNIQNTRIELFRIL